MMFKVSYTENVMKELVVEADSQEEAEQKVMNGDCDYDDAFETDAYVFEITGCKKWVG